MWVYLSAVKKAMDNQQNCAIDTGDRKGDDPANLVRGEKCVRGGNLLGKQLTLLQKVENRLRLRHNFEWKSIHLLSESGVLVLYPNPEEESRQKMKQNEEMEMAKLISLLLEEGYYIELQINQCGRSLVNM